MGGNGGGPPRLAGGRHLIYGAVDARGQPQASAPDLRRGYLVDICVEVGGIIEGGRGVVRIQISKKAFQKKLACRGGQSQGSAPPEPWPGCSRPHVYCFSN